MMMIANNKQPTELELLERDIERGLAGYIKAGKALRRIRDEKLYPETHGTFEAYCVDRFKIKKSRVYQIIESAGVAENLSNNGGCDPPANERQARELAAAPPARQAEIWTEAVETAPNHKPTARHVREVVRSKLEPAEEWQPEGESTPALVAERPEEPNWVGDALDQFVEAVAGIVGERKGALVTIWREKAIAALNEL